MPTSSVVPSNGLFLPAANTVGIATNSTEQLRIDAAGNVGIGIASTGYKLQVNGSFAATTKSFLIAHPTQPGRQLRYASLEGPENGVYLRGRLQGENQIQLPEYWSSLVDSSTTTVSLTSVNVYQELFVAHMTSEKITIGNNTDMIDCFYTVYAERRDVPKLVVEI